MTVDLERGYKRRELCGPKQYLNLLLRSVLMIYVGIDVAKDKHDCFITNSDGKVLFPVFTIQNNRDGFDVLFSRIQSSYYIVVVFIDPLQGLYAILFGDTVDWFHFPTT